MKLRIGLSLMWLNGRGFANHIGDHTVAEGWKKYLLRRGDVEAVHIAGPADPLPDDLHVVVHFHHGLAKHPTAKNIYYLQNAWPRGIQLNTTADSFRNFNPHAVREFPGGTPEVWNFFKEGFDGYIFASEGLKRACMGIGDAGVGRETDKDMVSSASKGLVLPFATDPELFTPQYDERFAHPVAWVGNDIRGPETNERYLIPALSHGLVIYGGPYEDPRLQAVNRGRVSAEDLPKVYSSAKVNLNVHIPVAAEFGMVNMRLYEILACGGRILSDFTKTLEQFSDLYRFTLGGDHVKYMLPWVDDPLAIDSSPVRRDFILANHTWAHRVADLMAWLKGVL